MENIQNKFIFGVVIVAVLIAFILYLYFSKFNGPLVDDISQWADFSSFVGNLSMLFLTALNIWVVYKLTYYVAKREENEATFEFKRDLINSFTNSVYLVFNQIDDEHLTCGIEEKNITKALDQFELFHKFSSVVTLFGTQEYLDFIAKYRSMINNYFYDDIGNINIDVEAYKVLSLAREIRFKLYSELAQNITINK